MSDPKHTNGADSGGAPTPTPDMKVGAADAAPDGALTFAVPWDSEIALIATQIQRFRDGDIPPEKFREFRLVHGIYGQKQPDVHMLRVKIPSGVLDADKLDALAEVAEHHGHGVAHLTTRQDVQYHYIPLEEFPELLRRMAPAGLMSREACGNSVRNVTTCPNSGVCPTEPFATLPYAQAVTRFLLRHPTAQLLARKFKIAFSGCPSDCAYGAIHDIGAIAALRVGAQGLERGFRLLVGGGTGSAPYVAQELTPFHPADDLLRACEAIVRIFSLHGNRKNRARARSKFVVHAMGIEKFRALFDETYAAIEAEGREDLLIESYLTAEEIAQIRESWVVPALRPMPAPDPPAADLADGDGYRQWLRFNARAQRQSDLRSVLIPFPIGDVMPEELRLLARLSRELGGIESRVTVQQNILLLDVPAARLPWLFEHLHHSATTAVTGEPSDLTRPVGGTALDIVTCPGADTCNLGITSSKGVGRAIADAIADLPSDQFPGATIKISGCPNGCSQHHVASIGLHGVARRVNGKQAPFYQLHLGGRIDEKGSAIAKGSLKVPAKKTPAILRRLLQTYLAERTEGEDLAEFFQRNGAADVERWLGPLLELESPAERPDGWLDWGEEREFTTATLGVGECAGAGVDESGDPFGEALEHLKQSRVNWDEGIAVDALTELNRAFFAAARIVLASGLKKQCISDWETLCEYRARLVDRGHVGDAFDELRRELDELLEQKFFNASAVPSLAGRVQAWVEEQRLVLAALQSWREDPERVALPGVSGHGDVE